MLRHLPVITIVIVATGLRVFGIGFGLPHTMTRPDEDAVMSIALHFFGRSFNPEFFDWPSLFMYVVTLGYVAYFNVGRLAGWFPHEITFLESASSFPAPLILIARWLSAITGVLTVWTVYRIGARLFDRTTALVAASLLAVAALHVRDSHFGVTDVAATALVMLSFLSTVHYAQTGKTRHAMLSALWAGAAASTKYNAGLIVLPAVWAILSGDGDAVATPWTARIRLLAGYGLISVAAFVAGTPYAVIDWRRFLTALAGVASHLRGGHIAFAGPGWIVHLTSSLRYGLGLPLVVAGIAGLVGYAWRDRRRGLLFGLFPIAYFVAIGSGQTTFARYIIPDVPFLCLAAAYLTVQTAHAITRRLALPGRAPAFAWGLAVTLAAPSAWSAIRTDWLLSRTDSRLLTADWMRQEFPRGVTMYQSGSSYGQVQMRTADPMGAAMYREVLFDEPSATFRTPTGTTSPLPEVIVLQEAPLPYCRIPDGIHRILASGYQRQRTFPAVDSASPGLVYDRDDAFFVPLAGFSAVVRPGPNLSIYVLKDLAPASSSKSSLTPPH